ncbi:hypothetical protein COT30_02520 [Candidatus Micrarchaeota archaeon CG08_land_8_20_14_0_20_49_17]|nr:MAG: hypothetical protein AUJ13_02960 [Candidatus Micrarchaeota archaeon CG1_02_49_24]PIU09809.1 MAG: hypothetical protein COT30_02520 [Candidatus Micrarchaeota archaeon CG08_land_8_20_14_0_20_49_17]PIU82371.1 MAG: hypothetical protein COS70_01665 [Candidatus Micrarchaeota archaeon CG06_land_8_20_14_3_00_50_6]PIZ92229.1 MAG: hypothetical protein COX84_07090 [Candidatus Micrarchaeota archaeon CG_4_10_14_0_2_um_filter_49_7]HII53435.1 hypothetical protein [Candidatus Micrarchaeota archaeon]
MGVRKKAAATAGAASRKGHKVFLSIAKKKLRVGFFSFTGCEGCVVMFTEILNTKYKEWFEKVEFGYACVLQSKNDMRGLDVAFIEGAIGSDVEARMLKEVRANCKKLVVIGSCAINGRPSDQRNYFDAGQMSEIKFVLDRFHLYDKVIPANAVVKVDAEVPGCPIIEEKFIEMMESCIKEFSEVKKA